jgi:hypothetical protein
MPAAVTLTLNQIRAHSPCENGWRRLLASKGKTAADDEPFPLLDVLDSNGVEDALWCLQHLGPEHHGWIRHLACDYAEAVLHLVPAEETRPAEAIRVARLYADGKATDQELAAARGAAWGALLGAAWTTYRGALWAAQHAARPVAAETAWHAATSAAWAAARGAQAQMLRDAIAKVEAAA